MNHSERESELSYSPGSTRVSSLHKQHLPLEWAGQALIHPALASAGATSGWFRDQGEGSTPVNHGWSFLSTGLGLYRHPRLSPFLAFLGNLSWCLQLCPLPVLAALAGEARWASACLQLSTPLQPSPRPTIALSDGRTELCWEQDLLWAAGTPFFGMPGAAGRALCCGIAFPSRRKAKDFWEREEVAPQACRHSGAGVLAQGCWSLTSAPAATDARGEGDPAATATSGHCWPFFRARCLAGSSSACGCGCQGMPVPVQVPWAEPEHPGAGRALGELQLLPGSDSAQVTPAAPTHLPLAAHQLEKVFSPAVLLYENIFLSSAAFYAFVPAFPAPKRIVWAALACSLAVLGISGHQCQVRTSQSSLSSVSSASPTQRRPNLVAHGWIYKLQTIIPFCALLHQPGPPCESRASGRQQTPDRREASSPQQLSRQLFTGPECPQALKKATAPLCARELGHWALCVAGIWMAAAAAGTTCAGDTVGTQQSPGDRQGCWDTALAASSAVPLAPAGRREGKRPSPWQWGLPAQHTFLSHGGAAGTSSCSHTELPSLILGQEPCLGLRLGDTTQLMEKKAVQKLECEAAGRAELRVQSPK